MFSDENNRVILQDYTKVKVNAQNSFTQQEIEKPQQVVGKVTLESGFLPIFNLGEISTTPGFNKQSGSFLSEPTFNTSDIQIISSPSTQNPFLSATNSQASFGPQTSFNANSGTGFITTTSQSAPNVQTSVTTTEIQRPQIQIQSNNNNNNNNIFSNTTVGVPITQAPSLSTTQTITLNQQTNFSLFQTQSSPPPLFAAAAVNVQTNLPTNQPVQTSTSTILATAITTTLPLIINTQSPTQPVQTTTAPRVTTTTFAAPSLSTPAVGTTTSVCNYVQSCDQVVTGRGLNYDRVLQIIQDEEYLSKADTSIIRRNFFASQVSISSSF